MPVETIPASPSDITAEWLTEAFAAQGIPGTQGKVRTCRTSRLPVQGFNAMVVRVEIEWSDNDPALPSTLVAKLRPADEGVFAWGRAVGAYQREVGFYRDLQPLPTAVPKCYFAAAESTDGNFIILLEDLGAGRTLFDEAQMGAAHARKCGVWAMQALAHVHAYWLNLPEKPLFAWLSQDDFVALRRAHLGEYSKHVELFTHTRTYRGLPEAMQQFVHDWVENYNTKPDKKIWTTPDTLAHGDFWPGQVFINEDHPRPVSIIDWEFVALRSGFVDVARMTQDILGFGVDRSHEQAMISEYLSELEHLGVPRYQPEQVVADLALGLAHVLEIRIFALAKGHAEEDELQPWIQTLIWAFEAHQVVDRATTQLG